MFFELYGAYDNKQPAFGKAYRLLYNTEFYPGVKLV